MTAGSNGTPEPENDDPFAYLYRGEGEEPPATGRPGVPRTSYHQVSRVGERRPAQQGGYGHPAQPPGQQQVYGQQGGQQVPAQYPPPAAPPARGGHGGAAGRGGSAVGGHGGGGRRTGGSDNRTLMIGAVAVVAVVAVGIGIVMASGDNGSDRAGGQPSSSPGTVASPSTASSASTDPNAGLPQAFAANLLLSGGAQTDNNHKNAKGPDGRFVDHMTTPGATATWTARVRRAGEYTLWVRYANAAPDDAKTTVVVNGKPLGWKINLKDYGTAGNWDLWYTSYVSVNLRKGANTIALTCGSGDVCHYNLDRMGLTTDSGTRPNGWS